MHDKVSVHDKVPVHEVYKCEVNITLSSMLPVRGFVLSQRYVVNNTQLPMCFVYIAEIKYLFVVILLF